MLLMDTKLWEDENSSSSILREGPVLPVLASLHWLPVTYRADFKIVLYLKRCMEQHLVTSLNCLSSIPPPDPSDLLANHGSPLTAPN